MERLVDPALADLQMEYGVARTHQHAWHARWILIVSVSVLLQVIALHLAERSLRAMRLPAAGDAWSKGRLLTSATVAVCVLTALQLWLSLSLGFIPTAVLVASPTVSRAWLAFCLLPSAVVIGLPWGFALAIVWTTATRAAARRRAAWLIVAAVALSAGSLTINGWITPPANQAFRVAVWSALSHNDQHAAPIGRGFNEFSLPELRRWLAVERSGLTVPAPPQRQHRAALAAAATSFHARIALSFAPLVLCLLALSLCGRRVAPSLLGTLLLSGAYFAACTALQVRAPATPLVALPIALRLWLPNIVVSAAALLLLRHPSDAPGIQASRSTD
jgi:hypothetical protein